MRSARNASRSHALRARRFLRTATLLAATVLAASCGKQPSGPLAVLPDVIGGDGTVAEMDTSADVMVGGDSLVVDSLPDAAPADGAFADDGGDVVATDAGDASDSSECDGAPREGCPCSKTELYKVCCLGPLHGLSCEHDAPRNPDGSYPLMWGEFWDGCECDGKRAGKDCPDPGPCPGSQ